MRTASCYTNKVRITAYAKNTKVDYPKHVAKNWEVLQATLPCNPNFDVQTYVEVSAHSCRKFVCANLVSTQLITEYSGGNAHTEATNILSGGNEATESPTILSGGNA